MNDAGAPWSIAPRHELPLRILLARDDEALRLGCRWIDEVDLDHLGPNTGRLLPQIYLRLRNLGVEHAKMSRLRGVHRHWWYRNQLQLGALRLVLASLAQRGVSAAPIGALALAHDRGEDGGARPISPAEVLIEENQLRTAVDALESASWQRVDRDCGRLTAAFAVARSSMLLRSSEGFELVVHWRLYDWGLSRRPAVDFAADTQAIDMDGVSARGLEPEELLLIVCALDPTRSSVPPTWATDAAAILRRGGLNWHRFVKRAQQAKVAANAGRALELLSRRFMLSVPAEVIASLSPRSTDQDLVIARLHRPRSEIGPLLYRCARHLRRSRQLPAGSLLVYFRDLWGLERRGDVPREALRRMVETARSRT